MGRVQVSTNVLDFGQTSVRALYDRIAQLAREVGIDVYRSELIGLVPAAAFEAEVAIEEGHTALTELGTQRLAAFVDHIRLPQFDPAARIVELSLARGAQGSDGSGPQ